MAHDLVMPRLSDSMEEGTVVKWLVSVGDEVSRGQEIVEIETDKATMPYESDGDGTLIEVVAGEGDTLAIGEVIARLGDPSEAGGDGAGPEPSEKEGEKEEGEEPQGSEEESEVPSEEPEEAAEKPRAGAPRAGDGRRDGSGGERVKASPVARRLAEERGVDLAALSGSGPGGRIVKADVEQAEAAPAEAAPAAEERPAEAGAPAPAEAVSPETAKGRVERVEPSRLQQTVARRMSESKATVPHFELEAAIDMTEAVALRSRLREIAGEGEPVPSYNDIVVKACAMALRDHPRANGSYRDGAFELHSRINVGIAVAAQEALTVPTVFDADRRTLAEIARTTRELASKVRDQTIRPPELSGGTFTVSNLGMYGISRFTAVINPPQAAILAVGSLELRPVVDDRGAIVPRHLMNVTLACDHRILYGAEGAEFLADVRSYLEQPLRMI